MTDSSNKETVEVPVELLKKIQNAGPDELGWVKREMKALIPKPKSRFVAVEPDKLAAFITNWMDDGTRDDHELVEDIGRHFLGEQPDVREVLENILVNENISQFVRQAVLERFEYALEQTK